MTRDDIIRMAREAHISHIYSDDALERFAALVAAAEREACAEIAEKQLRNTAMLTCNPPKSAAAWDIRNAILARGET